MHFSIHFQALTNFAKSEKAADGKSYINPPTGVKSKAYESFTAPITNGDKGGFDVHIYYMQVVNPKYPIR